MKNYYTILEVTPDSDVAAIRESYRRLSQQSLWDKDQFAELQEAFDTLASPEKRLAYDKLIFAAHVSEGAPARLTRAEGYAVETPPLVSNIVDPIDKLAVSEFGRRCPMGSSGECPVASGKMAPGETICPECGVEVESLPEPAATLEPPEREWVAHLDEETGRQHMLGIGQNSVGREIADVLLPDKTVSRLHARIDISPDRIIVVEDFGSTNGTMINGERLAPQKPRVIGDGDTVRFGSIRLMLRVVGHAADYRGAEEMAGIPADFDLVQVPSIVPSLALNMPSLAVPYEPEALNPLERLFRGETMAPAPAKAKLIATRGDIISEHALLDGITTFGRRADCAIVIRNDPYVSSTHAQISAENETFVLTDLGSTNGTVYNGEKLLPDTPVQLTAGDEIVIGGTIFRFEQQTASGEASEGE